MGLFRRIEEREYPLPTEWVARASFFADKVNAKILPTKKRQYRWKGFVTVKPLEGQRHAQVEVKIIGHKKTIDRMLELEPILCETAHQFAGKQIYFEASDYRHGVNLAQVAGYSAIGQKYPNDRAHMLGIYNFSG